jgi:hypothetical protein
MNVPPRPRRSRTLRWTARVIAALLLGAVGQGVAARPAAAQDVYFRLQLKHGGQYLDSENCGATMTLHPGSEWEEGACQLWRFVDSGGGWYRLQLKHGGQYLDATNCSAAVSLNPGSTWEDGACQLWRLVPAGAGYYRLQLKHGGQYLDAKNCTREIALNPGSAWEDGACQLWRLVSG